MKNVIMERNAPMIILMNIGKLFFCVIKYMPAILLPSFCHVESLSNSTLTNVMIV